MQISVIIPVYNINIDDLDRCVSSILHQTFSDFEIIIVNDGSRTNTAESLDTLAQRDVRIKLLHKKNEGVSVARNYGVKYAAGKYIMFVDGDDILTPWALEQGLSALNSTNSDIAIGRVLQTATYPEQFPEKNADVDLQVLETRQDRMDFEKHIYLKNVNGWGRNEKGWMFNPEGCWAHLVKREVAENIPFIPGIAVAEDTIWAVDLLRNKKNYTICLVDDLWYYYIQNDNSVLHRYSPNLGTKIGSAISVLNPIYEKEYDTLLYNAYLQWILSKLKQIVMKSYLSSECTYGFNKKRKKFMLMLSVEPWKTAVTPRKDASIEFKIKLKMHRSGIMLLILSILDRIKESCK